MSLSVRRASLITDRDEMLALSGRNLGSGPDFEWCHLKNPAGPAWSWLLYDENRETTVGMVSVFPRCVYVDGKPVLCGQVGEFAVDSGYRSLGPALLLQRTTFRPVDSGELAFCYDCPPHDLGLATFVRLGMHPNCELFRYALLLRSDEFLERKLGRSRWTTPLVGTANRLLRMRIPRRDALGLAITTLDGMFGDEFSNLDQSVPSLGLVRPSRSAKFLNWRYKDQPVSGQIRVLVARRNGELWGFLVFVVRERALWIFSAVNSWIRARRF
jgi:hypothetical protein